MHESTLTVVDESIPTTLQKLQVSQVFSALNTSSSGLTEEEVKKRLEHYGQNVITKAKGKPLWIRFLANFTHLMAILLWVGGIIGFIAKMPQYPMS
jgi:magnesium-transporting ATPase (P-type)